MKVLALILASVVLVAQDSQTLPRVTFDAQPDSIAGELLVRVKVHTGHGGPDSAPRPVAFFTGRLNQRAAEDTLLNVFLLASPQDTTRLQQMLTTFRAQKQELPQLEVRAWSIQQEAYPDLSGVGTLLTVPVNADGAFTFDVEIVDKRLMTLVDTAGRVAAQRPIWEE